MNYGTFFDYILKNKKISIFLLIFITVFISFYLYVSICTEFGLKDQDKAANYYNSYLLSKGETLNIGFQSVFPGINFFYSIFFILYPDINVIGLRMIGLIYLILTIFIILFAIKKVCQEIYIKPLNTFILSSIILCIPFYVSSWSVDLYYNNMPVLLISLIILLLMKDGKISLHFFIGILVGLLILIKHTFFFLLPFFICYYLILRKNYLDVKISKVITCFFVGISLPLIIFLIYLFINDALLSTIKVYVMHASQQGYENKVFLIFRNFLYILPGTLFIYLSFKVAIKKKIYSLLVLATWMIYFIFLRYLNINNLLSYAIGTMYCGIMLAISTEISNKRIKYIVFLILIICTFVVPLGSRQIYLPLTFFAILNIPFIFILLIYLKNKMLLLPVITFLLILLFFQSKSRIWDFTLHNMVNHDCVYKKYSEYKFKYIYGRQEEVDELEQVAKKMRSYIPLKTYVLIYPRFPIYYWIVENAVSAMAKIDPETAYSDNWIKYNFNEMIKNNRIPKYIFYEIIFDEMRERDLIGMFIRKNYKLINTFWRFNIYVLNT